MQPSTILMTGGTGFLGSHLLFRLVKDGHKIILLKRSTSNLSPIQKIQDQITLYNLDEIHYDDIFSKHRFSCVLHCATHYGRKLVDPIRTIEANLILPLQLLKRAVEAKVPTFINTDTLLDKRISTYSLSKRQFSEWMDTYKSQITCLNLALEHFYGAGDDTSKFSAWVIQELLNQSPHLNLTEGRQLRDFIHISDVIEAFCVVMKNRQTFSKGIHRFEVGTGEPVSIRQFVELARNLSGNTKTELRFGALPYRENEVMDSRVDICALNDLGWTPQMSLEKGLELTIRAERERMNVQ